MGKKISKTKYLIISFGLSALITANVTLWENVWLGTALSVAYCLFCSFILGSIYIYKKGWQPIFGLLFFISLIAIITAPIIYLTHFNEVVFVLTVILIPVLLITPYYRLKLRENLSFAKIFKEYIEKINSRKEPRSNTLLVISYLTGFVACLFFVIKGSSPNSIQSPWETINPLFFLLYFASSIALITYLLRSNRTKLPLMLVILHYLLSSSIAIIVYQIGYGFDPFIHRAAEGIINLNGRIDPAPLYYLGQYGIVVFLHKLTFIDLELIDKALVPLLFSIIIPSTLFFTFSHWVEKKYALIVTLTILCLPFTSFIMTAPQNLANLLFLLTTLLSFLYYHNKLGVSSLYLLAMATAFIHPLAGIPLLITVGLLNLFKILYESYRHTIIPYILAASVFIFAIPLTFIANGKTVELNFTWSKVTSFDLISFEWVNRHDLFLNFAYTLWQSRTLLAIIFIGIGVWYIVSHKLVRNYTGYFVSAAVIFGNYLITALFIDFSLLRDYDKADFTNRLLTLTFYVLIPLFIIGNYLFIRKFWSHNNFARIFIVALIAAVNSSFLYLSYPRTDSYDPSKFYSVSLTDLKTVNIIEQQANPDYIVLANQMIGAAAIKELGFKKYYANQFFYSMPMGLPQTRYGYYLEMIYGDTPRATIEAALYEAGVSEGYLVLNKYWNNFEKIKSRITPVADKVIEVDGGETVIYKFVLAN